MASKNIRRTTFGLLAVLGAEEVILMGVLSIIKMNSTPDKNVKTIAMETGHPKNQIAEELQNRKECAYSSYKCSQQALKNYNYCLQHILTDKTAPYRTCTFVYPGGKPCQHAAYKENKRATAFCNEHALRAHLLKGKQGAKMQGPRNAEYLLKSLSHYIATSKKSGQGMSGSSTKDVKEEDKVTKSLDPLVDIDAASIIASSKDVLDLCSDSDSDIEPPNLSNVWLDAHADSSEDESIDSDNGDYLKHADVFSADEVIGIVKDKLTKLHTMYINQYHHLFHLLKERRRRYLHAVKREKETCCSIRTQLRERPKDQVIGKQFKAYNMYHRKHGVDAICRKRLMEMRFKITEGLVYKPTSHSCRCIYSEGGIKCTERALPVAKHCRKHILHDTNQVLFRACGKKGGEVECTAAVESIFENQFCVLHREIPPRRIYSQLRKESDSEVEEVDNNKIKVEFNFPESPVEIAGLKEDNLSADEDAHMTNTALEIEDDSFDLDLRVETDDPLEESANEDVESMSNIVGEPKMNGGVEETDQAFVKAEQTKTVTNDDGDEPMEETDTVT